MTFRHHASVRFQILVAEPGGYVVGHVKEFQLIRRHCFCELFQHIPNVVVRGVTHRSQDIHHGTHQLVGVSVRDETFHLLVPGHVGCHANAQRDVTRNPVNLVTVRRKLFGVEPTLKFKGGSILIVLQRFGHSDVLVFQLFEYRWSRMVHATRIDSTHTPCTRAHNESPHFRHL